MDQNIDHLALMRFAIRADFFQVITMASVAGRKGDAGRLARLALNLCYDKEKYPFDVSELQRLNGFDFPLAMEFISFQRHYTQSTWEPSEDPNSHIGRLLRFATYTD